MTNSTSSQRAHGWLYAALALTALLAAANWRLLAGRGFEQWDAFDFFSPYYTLVADLARAGHLLFWNPWTNGGSPDFAEPQVGAFSPVLLIFALLFGGSSFAFRIYWLALWLSGGFGMLLLARHLRAPIWGGFCVALGFIFSGFYTGHAEHTSVLYSYSFLPFVIWRLDVALQGGNRLAAAQAGALWGLSAMAGNPVLTISSCGLIAAWGLGRLSLGGKNSLQVWRRGLGLLAIVAFTGLVVLAPSYFGFLYEGRGYSDRNEPLPRDFALGSNALHPGAIGTLISPAMMALRFADSSLWSYTNISSFNLYLGAVVLLLAVMAMANRKRDRWRWFLFVVALLALACAVSRVLPLRGWIYDLVPPTRYFRHSSMFRGYFMFLLCVLALFGSRDLARVELDKRICRKFLLVSFALGLVAASAFAVTACLVNTDFALPLPVLLHLPLVWGSLLFLGLTINRAPVRLARWLPRALVVVAVVDGLLTCYLSEPVLYGAGPSPDSIVPHQTSIVTRAGRAVVIARSNLNLIAKIPTLQGYAPFKNSFHEATAASPALAPIALGRERFWFAPSAPLVELKREAFSKFGKRVQQLRYPIIVRHSRAMMLHSASAASFPEVGAIESAAPARRLSARIIHYEPNRLVLDVSVPGDGWLMVTDRWSRSWGATVNGKPAAVEGADFIYRAVAVTKGENHVDFTFHPPAVRALASVSWALLGGIALLSLARPRRRRAPGRPPLSGTNPASVDVTENGLEPHHTAAARPAACSPKSRANEAALRV